MANYAYKDLSVDTQGYSSGNKAYTFRIEAEESETDTDGSKRKVNITYSVYAKSPGGYQSFSSPKASILIDGDVVKGPTNIKNIWPRNTWQTLLTWSGYLEGATSHSIVGRFNSGTSSYDYLPKNGNQNVTLTYTPTAASAVLKSITLDSNFITNGKFTPVFTDPVGVRYYGFAILATTPLEIIASWNDPIITKVGGGAITSGNPVALTSAQLSKVWELLRARNNSMQLSFALYTYKTNQYQNGEIIGVTNIEITSDHCKIPTYTTSWSGLSFQDANANDQYGKTGNLHPLSYYIPSGSLCKLLSKMKVSFNTSSNKGTFFGATRTYKVKEGSNEVSASSPWTSSKNYEGEIYKVNCTVNDNLNLTTNPSEYTYSPTVINYFKPYLSNYSVVRPNPTGTTINVSYTLRYFDGTGMVSSSLSNCSFDFYYSYNGSSWTKVSALSGTGTNGSITKTSTITGIDPTKPFYYKLEVSDRIGITISPASSLPKGLPIWNTFTKANGTDCFQVNGDTILKNSIRGREITGTSGSKGWIKFLEITSNQAYSNQIMSFDLLHRGGKTEHIELWLKNLETNRSIQIEKIRYSGDGKIAYKIENNILYLITKKSEAYDSIEVLNFKKGYYMRDIFLNWVNVQVSTDDTVVPSGYTLATEGGNLFLGAYPIGSIYISINNVNPTNYFGGSWEPFGTGKTLVGVDSSDTDFNTVEKTGGQKMLQSHQHPSKTLKGQWRSTKARFPGGSEHSGIITEWIANQSTYWSSGGGKDENTVGWKIDATHAHDAVGGGTSYSKSPNNGNLQPYITVYMWKRTA